MANVVLGLTKDDVNTFQSEVSQAFRNGPGEISITQGADSYDRSRYGLRYQAGFSAMDLFLANYRGSTDKCKQIVAGMSLLVCSCPTIIDPKSLITGVPIDGQALAAFIAATHGAQDAREAFDATKDTAVRNAALVLIAAKVNWWKTNHHTGQGTPTGYFKKVVTMLGGFDSDDIHYLHGAVHWADTREVLRELFNNGSFCSVPVDRSILMRINSNPAGTARVCDFFTGVKLIHDSAYGIALPGRIDYDLLESVINAIAASPFEHHVGAAYLTGQAPKSVAEFEASAEDVVWVSSVLNVTHSGHTILDSQVFKSVTPSRAIMQAIKSSGLLNSVVVAAAQPVAAPAPRGAIAAGAPVPLIDARAPLDANNAAFDRPRFRLQD